MTKLATYAVTEQNSKGRQYVEKSPADRNEFERDYARIIHSEAWRKMQYKTQVFANHRGDSFRTRCTHSLEVAQVSRTCAQALGLNADLAETLAIAHDLGHAPFGHTGQDMLNELMKDHGGFEHNLQALKIVDHIEKAYLNFEGLNLMQETREGLLKHCSKENATLLGSVAERHLKGRSASLEAQVVNLCDAIAYNHADLEDAYNMKAVNLEQLLTIPLFKATYEKHLKDADDNISKEHPVLISTSIRSMFKAFTKDMLANTRKNIDEAKIVTLEDVKNSPELVKFSPEMAENHYGIKRFLRSQVYSNPGIIEERQIQEKALKYIFKKLVKNPLLMGEDFNKDNADIHRQVCDFIANMTDRYAMASYKNIKKLTDDETIDDKNEKKYSPKLS